MIDLVYFRMEFSVFFFVVAIMDMANYIFINWFSYSKLGKVFVHFSLETSKSALIKSTPKINCHITNSL